MASLYFLHADAIECHELPSDRPTRFDASGAILPTSSALFDASIVPFSVTPVRFALVAGPRASVALGAWRESGVVELADRERLFVADREYLLSYDALPIRVDPADLSRGASCPVCDRTEPAGSASHQRACPRCGARACKNCWKGFRSGRCLTPHCQQPAALERELWSPSPTDFLDLESAVRAAPAGT